MDTSCMATVITCQRIGRNHQQHDHHDQPGPMATKELMMCAARLLPIVVERDPYVMPRHAAQQKQRAKHDNRRVRSDHNASPMSFTAYAWKKPPGSFMIIWNKRSTRQPAVKPSDSRAHARRKDNVLIKSVITAAIRLKASAAGHSRQRHGIEEQRPNGAKMLAIPNVVLKIALPRIAITMMIPGSPETRCRP